MGGEERPTVSEIERLLYRFPEVVERAAQEYEPHYIATFLTELAGVFNSWYTKEKIIGASDSAYKLTLTKVVHQTMLNGLWLLGIKTPERM
jgi:arginyl-tRNA synthetase